MTATTASHDAAMTSMPVPRLARVASVIYIFLGLAFGASVPWVLLSFAENGYLPMTFGFRSLAGGPFEQLDSGAFIALGSLLVLISTVGVTAGLLLWRGRRIGAWLGLATDPLAFALRLGFALPLLLVGVPVRAGLVLLVLRRLVKSPREAQ